MVSREDRAVSVLGGAPVAEVSSLTPGQIVSVSLPAVVASDGAPLTINITLTSAGNLTLSARGEAASSAVELGEAPASPVYIGGLPPGHSMAATYPSFRGCLHTVLVTGPAPSRYLTFADTEAGERSGVEVDSEQCRAEAVPMVPSTQPPLTEDSGLALTGQNHAAYWDNFITGGQLGLQLLLGPPRLEWGTRQGYIKLILLSECIY